MATVFSSLLQLQDLSLNLEMNDLGEEGALSLLEALRATRPAASQIDLGDCAIGKGAVALARALRSGEVSCRVTHPVVEMLLREEFKDEEAGKLELGLSSKEDVGLLCQALPLLSLREVELRFADLGLGEEGAFSLLEALRAASPASTQLYLGENDIGKGAFALARALRAGEVKGEVAHPVVEFLVQLEDQTLKELEETQKLVLDLFGGGDKKFRELFEPLCRALPELPKLRELVLDLGRHDSFGDDGARALAAGLGQQKELERLILLLHENCLGEEGAKAVASALARLTELKELELNLSLNKIGDAGAAAVAESLRNLRQLTKVDVRLYGSTLGEEGAKAVASALARLTELEELKLYLRENVIGDAGAAAVAESLRNLRQLTKLEVRLSESALGAAGATAVVESLRDLPQLTKLEVYLRDNALGEEEKQKLRATFDALPVREKHIRL